MAMSGSHSILGASDEDRDIYCEPCHQAGQIAVAEGYCVDCPEYLCGQCFNRHRMHKALANHVLLSKDSMPLVSDSSRRVLDVCVEKCPIHPNKVTEFFCETCSQLGCQVCVMLNHRQCENLKHIPDIIEDTENDNEFQVFNKYIMLLTRALSEHEEMLKTSATSNSDMRTLAKIELKCQRAKVKEFFDQLEKKMDDQITAMEERNKDSLKAASDRLDQIKKELDQIKNDIKAKNIEQKCELFIVMKRSQEKIRRLDDQLNKVQGELRTQNYKLLPSEQIEAMMRTTTEICSVATARLDSMIDINTSRGETELDLHGLTIMHGHYCVVADNDNKSVMVMDTKRKQVTSEMGIEAKTIWSVTSVGDDQVAVSVSVSDNRNQIQFFSVSESGVIQKTNKQYDVDNCYWNMVHCTDNIYGLTADRIDTFNMTGKITKTIQTDDKGFDLFVFLEGIASSPDGKTLYVTDKRKNSVTSLTLDGKVKAFYNDKDLDDPCGITVDKHGFVYVRSLGTHNIHQLTADLNKVQILIEDVDGINITYSSTKNKLYINTNNQIYQYSLDFK